MDNVHIPYYSVCYKPSSEPFTVYVVDVLKHLTIFNTEWVRIFTKTRTHSHCTIPHKQNSHSVKTWDLIFTFKVNRQTAKAVCWCPATYGVSLHGRTHRQSCLTAEECLLRILVINGLNFESLRPEFTKDSSLFVTWCVYILLFAATLYTTKTSASVKMGVRTERRRDLSTRTNKLICPPVRRSRREDLPQFLPRDSLFSFFLFCSYRPNSALWDMQTAGGWNR
jgi:hypothetical protein